MPTNRNQRGQFAIVRQDDDGNLIHVNAMATYDQDSELSLLPTNQGEFSDWLVSSFGEVPQNISPNYREVLERLYRQNYGQALPVDISADELAGLTQTDRDHYLARQRDRSERHNNFSREALEERTQLLQHADESTPLPDPNTLLCHDCAQRVNRDDTQTIGGYNYCTACIDDHFFDCDNCGEPVNSTHDDHGEYNGQELCQTCYDDITSENDDDDDDDSEFHLDIPRRNFVHDLRSQFASRNNGNVIKSQRIFSIEIECIAPSQEAMNTVASNLADGWGITPDGSLNNNGVEFQSPKLMGKQGEQAIKDFCKLLNDNGFKIDASCGFHIHIDQGEGSNLVPTPIAHTDNRGNVVEIESPRAPLLQNLWAFYLTFEDVILSFLPRERRMNNYCRQLRSEYSISQIFETVNLDEIEKLWYKTKNKRNVMQAKGNHYHDTRYSGINLHCLLSEGHLEVRYHSGTLNARKILEWANLHMRIIDDVVGSRINREAIRRAYSLLTIDEKLDYFFSILKLEEPSRDYFKTRIEKFLHDKKKNKENDLDAELSATPNQN